MVVCIWQLSAVAHCWPCAPAADALGGNSLALIVGTLRQGEWELSSCTLKQLTAGRQVSARA
jgi:hypothetical protein